MQAAGALDVIETLGEAIARDGAIIYGPTGPKAHPAIKDQIAARAFLVRAFDRCIAVRTACVVVAQP